MTVDETERLRMAVERLEAEVARLKGETYCAYCGERFPLDAPDSVERIGQHIAECLKHPMRIVEAERDTALAESHRLKAHTWQQERAAVVARLMRQSHDTSIRVSTTFKNLCTLIERGEHWPERENG